MKVLVSTEETQGQRENDFCWVPEGELVTFHGFECDGESVDGSCGCRRSFTGLVSRTATTTARVVDAEIDSASLRDAVRESLTKAGWMDDSEYSLGEEDVELEAADIERVAREMPLNAIIERRGEDIQVRE